jgi:hypothetical protein
MAGGQASGVAAAPCGVLGAALAQRMSAASVTSAPDLSERCVMAVTSSTSIPPTASTHPSTWLDWPHLW